MEAYVKCYRREGEVVLAACDRDIAGKSFSSGGMRLDVKKDFYCGEIVKISELCGLFSGASIVNLAGNDVVGYAVEKGLVDSACVLDIGGVKHAQIVSMV